MFRIEHVALWSCDIERMASFYARYFSAQVGPRYENQAKGFCSRFLTFEGGTRLEIMGSTALQPRHTSPSEKHAGYAHLAFTVGDEAAVRARTELLRGEGYAVLGEPRRTGDGYYESVVSDPDGNAIELCAE